MSVVVELVDSSIRRLLPRLLSVGVAVVVDIQASLEVQPCSALPLVVVEVVDLEQDRPVAQVVLVVGRLVLPVARRVLPVLVVQEHRQPQEAVVRAVQTQDQPERHLMVEMVEMVVLQLVLMVAEQPADSQLVDLVDS